jgi:uncharacterized protein DUF6134
VGRDAGCDTSVIPAEVCQRDILCGACCCGKQLGLPIRLPIPCEASYRPEVWSLHAVPCGCFAVNPRLISLAVFALTLAGSPLLAGDVEVRTFSINIDNQKAGELRITATKFGDGICHVSAESVIRTKRGDGWRRVAFSGMEHWKNGRLQNLEAQSIDDGDRREIKAALNDGKLRIFVNGQRSDAPLDVWTSTWWTAPEMPNPVRAIAVLEPDTGRVISAQIERVGLDHLTVLDKSQDFTHFHLEGQKLRLDLWYDNDDHLVRAAGIENNQPFVLELIKVQR